MVIVLVALCPISYAIAFAFTHKLVAYKIGNQLLQDPQKGTIAFLPNS